jgi:sporulation protein YlmC with PRC-barrel domain
LAPPRQAIKGRDVRMLEEVSELIGIQVYTNKGTFLGNVSNVILDIEDRKLESLFITDTNPLLVEDSRNVAVPYRWVSSVGDIILLRFFPKRVSVRKASPPPQAPPEDFQVVE